MNGQAAVLIPLLDVDGVRSVLFEVRAYDLDWQPGDVCFPGGHCEGEETPKETVLREAEEELLLPAGQISVISSLPPRMGPGNVLVTPLIGEVTGYTGTFAPDEVDHVFAVPLDWFLANEPTPDPGCYYTIPEDVRRVIGGKQKPQNPAPVLWGFTGRTMQAFVTEYRTEIRTELPGGRIGLSDHLH